MCCHANTLAFDFVLSLSSLKDGDHAQQHTASFEYDRGFFFFAARICSFFFFFFSCALASSLLVPATFGFCLSGINLENSCGTGWNTDSGSGGSGLSFSFSSSLLLSSSSSSSSTTAFVSITAPTGNSQISSRCFDTIFILRFSFSSIIARVFDQTDFGNAFSHALVSNSHVNFPITSNSSSSLLLILLRLLTFPPNASHNTCAPKFTANIFGCFFSFLKRATRSKNCFKCFIHRIDFTPSTAECRDPVMTIPSYVSISLISGNSPSGTRWCSQISSSSSS